MRFNINEGGKFFTMAFNYMNLWLFMALAIPYPWYGRYRNLNRLEEFVTKWHFRYKVLSFVIYKANK